MKRRGARQGDRVGGPMTPLQFTLRRKRLFGSQKKAAQALGVTQQALSNWETGWRVVPAIIEKFLECLERSQMTRKIICLKCAERKPGNYPGEWWHREQGKARGFKNGDFVCDLCNATIPKGTECVAESFGLDRDPYRAWEDEYISQGDIKK